LNHEPWAHEEILRKIIPPHEFIISAVIEYRAETLGVAEN